MQKFEPFYKNMQPLSGMEGRVQLAAAKETRDQQVLLKLRPQLALQVEWSEAIAVMQEHVTCEGGEYKTGAATANPLA